MLLSTFLVSVKKYLMLSHLETDLSFSVTLVAFFSSKESISIIYIQTPSSF